MSLKNDQEACTGSVMGWSTVAPVCLGSSRLGGRRARDFQDTEFQGCEIVRSSHTGCHREHDPGLWAAGCKKQSQGMVPATTDAVIACPRDLNGSLLLPIIP